jgi:hypothetical protein
MWLIFLTLLIASDRKTFNVMGSVSLSLSVIRWKTDPVSATLWFFWMGWWTLLERSVLNIEVLPPKTPEWFSGHTVGESVYKMTILHTIAFIRMWICIKVVIYGFVLADGCTSSTSVSPSAVDNCPVKPYFPQKTYLRFDQANIGVITGEKEVNIILYRVY